MTDPWLFQIILSTLCMLASCIFSNAGCFLISGILLIFCGIYLFFYQEKRSGNLLCPQALFSVSFLSCLGVSALKLSRLQTVWELRTWICFWLIYTSFTVSFSYFQRKTFRKAVDCFSFPTNGTSVFPVILLLTAASYLSFFTEAVLLGFIPLFTEDTPHAYSYFHVSGLHYFTVLCVLVPSLSVFFLNTEKKSRRENRTVILCTVLCLFLPVLLVSRYQLIFAVMLSVFTFLILKKDSLRQYLTKKNLLLFFCSVVSFVLLYVFLTVERAHSISYLNGIFEMKNPDMPIFITQPYIYIANNFDNFNCLVRDLSGYSYGIRSLFPFFALTGLKFAFPELVSFPLYITKEELTTVTMFYDAYYDFGISGVILFSVLLGLLMAVIEKVSENRQNAGAVLISAQITGYLCLAFFTTWFSNPTTWFYLVISIAVEIYLWYNQKKIHPKERMEKNDR